MGGKARGPGPRSFEVLRWLEPLEVAGLEPLGLAHRFGERATYSHVQRLADAGLVARTYDRDGSLVALTREGRRRPRPDAFAIRTPRGGLIRNSQSTHARAVSWAAARATLRGHEWVSDRDMRLMPEWQVPVIWSRRGNHRPDIGVGIGGRRLAIEVELTAKSPSRLRAILAGYENELDAGRFAGLIYVVDDVGVRRGVERAARQSGLRRDQFRIWAFHDVQDRVRSLAREYRRP